MADQQELAAWRDAIWAKLARASADRRSDWRTPVLSTVSADGGPQARVVVLRRASGSEGVLEIHTDRRSAKWRDLQARGNAALTFWDAKAALQLRVLGRARLEEGAAAAAVYDALSAQSRRAYAVTPAPGAVIEGPSSYSLTAPEADSFGLIRIAASQLEALSLDPAGHRRARWRLEADWRGDWLAP